MNHPTSFVSDQRYAEVPKLLQAWGQELGFSAIGISAGDTTIALPKLQNWLDKGLHGTMHFMSEHHNLRHKPSALVPGTRSIISATLPYWPATASPATEILKKPDHAYISRYALGRDYHRGFRQKLQKLASRLEEKLGTFAYRVFSDSAPVFEVEFAQQALLGWRGKHSLLVNREGSWHFLGEIYTDLPLPVSQPNAKNHCGRCTKCLTACPTGAIVAPYQVDARRCISYLTIEHKGDIPEDLRPLLGNRIYGCDDCQLVCPWNRFATAGASDFLPRQELDSSSLISLFMWDEAEFEKRLQGSPIRRMGYERWLRNIAIALGNAAIQMPEDARAQIIKTLKQRETGASPMVGRHIAWSLGHAFAI